MAAAASTLLELIRHPPFSLTHHRSAMLCSDHQRKSNIVRLQIVVLLGLLLFCYPNCALARSGGRIGGSTFSSRSRTSPSLQSPRFSYPSSSSTFRSSYHSTSTYPRSYPSSYSAPYRYRSSYPASYRYPRSYPAPRTSDPSSSYNKSEFGVKFYVILVCITLLFLVGLYISKDTRKTSVIKLQETTSVIRLQETTSVIKLQVGLLGSGRTLQQYLTRLAENADTSTSEGLRYVLIEATLALMRHSDYFISCYSSVDVKPSIKDGEQRFKKLSIEERVKFDDETLVNVNSILRRSSKTRTCTGLTNEYIVVTILVAAEGIHILQPINGSLDLKEALKKLQWIPRNNIMAVEVLWTPQNERDTLSERELLEDYPHLRLL